MWWFSFECKDLVSIHSHLQFSQHLIWFLSGVHHPRTACTMDELIYWAPVGSGLSRKHRGEWNSCSPLPSCCLGDWRRARIRHLRYDHLRQSVVRARMQGTWKWQEPPPRKQCHSWGLLGRWCCQIKLGAMEDTKPGRGGGIGKVSRWQEPEWAEWSAGRLACLGCREQKSGVWDKAVAIRPTSCSFPVYFSVLLCVF